MYSVLIVSGVDRMLQRMEKYLPNVNRGVSVIPARSDTEAISAVMASSLDIIIYYHDGGMDAFGFYDMIARYTGGALPFILMSPEKDADLAIRAMDFRMDYYVPADTPNLFIELSKRVVMAVERAKIAEIHAMSTERSSAISDLMNMKDKPLDDVLKYALEESVRITGSAIGYVATYNGYSRKLNMVAWSQSVMDDCAMKEAPTVYDLDRTGVWGDPVRFRKSIIINDYEHEAVYLKKGTPEGHVKLARLLMVPIIRRGAVIATAGVANKPSEYTREDEEQLRLLMGGLISIHEDRLFDDSRRDKENRVSEIVDMLPIGVMVLDAKGHFKHINGAAKKFLRVTDEYVTNGTIYGCSGRTASDIATAMDESRSDISRRAVYSHDLDVGGFDGVMSVITPSAAAGEIVQWVVGMTDMSMLFRSTGGLKPLRERFRAINTFIGHTMSSVLDDVEGLSGDGAKLADAIRKLREMRDYANMDVRIGASLPKWMDLRGAIGSAPKGVKFVSVAEEVSVLVDPTFPSAFDILFRFSRWNGASEV